MASDETATRRHVHGFHSYAARLHPDTARRLVEALSSPGETILDPFCGSGTVLVESMLSGRSTIGVDANPLAVELSSLKTRVFDDGMLEEIVAASTRVAAHAEDRRALKMGPTKRYGEEDRGLFDVHVLLELDGVKRGLDGEPDREIRRILRLVLSSILVKVSRRPGDTAEGTTPRRLAGGFVIRTFVRKAEELVRVLRQFRELLPEPRPECRVLLGDAQHLEGVAHSSVHAVITSPPYPGVYDYYSQHALRLRWLELDATDFERAEVGARRRLERLPFARALGLWEGQMGKCLGAMRRVLRPNARAALVMADAVLAGKPVYADRLLQKLAPATGFEIVAVASQRRPHFHAGSRDAFRANPRREYVFVLDAASAASPGPAIRPRRS